MFTDAEGEVSRAIDVVEFACGIPQLLKGDYTDQVSTGIDNWTMRQPLGVVAGITPFNFPCMVPAWMFLVAISVRQQLYPEALANRSFSPSLMLADLWKQAGLPDGVFNVFQGDKIASTLCLRTRGYGQFRLSARRRSRTTSTKPVPVTANAYRALGGAKNHMIVMPDADIDQAVDALVGSAYGRQASAAWQFPSRCWSAMRPTN